MTVEQYLETEKIDLDFIETKMEGPYWESCLKFISTNYNRKIDTLSQKQISWLTKILEDCVEKRLEK